MRRKSTVLFSSVLEDYEKQENQSFVSEKEDLDDHENNIVETRSYCYPSSHRMSIFSRISEISFQTLNHKYQCIFLMSAFLIIFLIGLFVGALAVKFFFCFSYQDNVQISDYIAFNNVAKL